MRVLKNITVALLVLLPSILTSQTLDVEKWKTKYPDEHVIILDRLEHLTIDYDNDEFKIIKEATETKAYLSQDQLWRAEEEIYFDEFSEIKQIEAVTKIPNKKGKLQSIEVDKIDTKDVMDAGIFFGGRKKKSFTFPGVQQGAITEVSYVEELHEPRFLGGFYFIDNIPVQNASYSISFPKSVEIGYYIPDDFVDAIEFTDSEEDDRKTYTWSLKEQDAFEGEPNMFRISYYAPHVITYIKNVSTLNGNQPVLNSVDGLYKWYSGLVDKMNNETSDEIKEIVGSITNDQQSKREKVEAIFGWVQNNISYVAFEEGMEGFIPRNAQNVCTKKYGDCKDMANLIKEMLAVVNIEAYLTWIGTRDIPYSYLDVPSPVSDNHMIASVVLDEELVFLDATAQFLPFGFPSPMIQGKEALVGISPTDFKLETVPIINADENKYVDVNELTIEGDKLNGKAELAVSGFHRLDFEGRLAMTEAQTNEMFLAAYIDKGTNKTTVSDFELVEENYVNEDFKVNYTFTIPSYVRPVNDRIYVNLNIDRPFANSEIDTENDKYDKKIEYKEIYEFRKRLKIPDGFNVKSLPEPSSFADEKLSFDSVYKIEGSFIELEQTVKIDLLKIEVDYFEKWNEFVKALQKTYSSSIVLEKNK